VRGWASIGYHFGIELLRDQYEILLGRSLLMDGAHCKEKGLNRNGIGICLVGDFDIAPPPEEQLELALKLCEWLCVEFEIPPSRVIGHREAAPWKTCPGLKFPLEEFRTRLAERLDERLDLRGGRKA